MKKRRVKVMDYVSVHPQQSICDSQHFYLVVGYDCDDKYDCVDGQYKIKSLRDDKEYSIYGMMLTVWGPVSKHTYPEILKNKKASVE
jgi:hypothetical protein